MYVIDIVIPLLNRNLIVPTDAFENLTKTSRDGIVDYSSTVFDYKNQMIVKSKYRVIITVQLHTNTNALSYLQQL